MALLLKKRGITRVRPLEGGLDAWKEAGYPVDGFEVKSETLTMIQS